MFRSSNEIWKYAQAAYIQSTLEKQSLTSNLPTISNLLKVIFGSVCGTKYYTLIRCKL